MMGVFVQPDFLLVGWWLLEAALLCWAWRSGALHIDEDCFYDPREGSP